ncbi:MAG: winged helix-turn-helix transcriptional regulator [Candidatus Rokubacteria bacterium]|nr:winged helix-turn-helix transcriptional regulator [Candidatus Rokubacteria bacterium]
MDPTSLRDLRILSEIAERQHVTQRSLSKKLGIALGLTNLYLKRLGRKGYIKITTIPSNRVKYLLTPKGVAQKTRLTYEYMRFSLHLYRETRGRLRDALRRMEGNGGERVAVYGEGEAAELACLTLMELGIELAAVYSNGGGGSVCGHKIRPLTELEDGGVDRVVVALFRPPSVGREALERRGISPEKLVFLA